MERTDRISLERHLGTHLPGRLAALALALLDEKGDITGAARARERLEVIGIAFA